MRRAFPPDRGGLTRGIPTGFAAPPLIDIIAQPDEPPPVWPDPEGKVRGYEFSPLFKSAPKAVAKDKRLYELRVLVDAIRGGRARERDIAVKELRARLKDEKDQARSSPSELWGYLAETFQAFLKNDKFLGSLPGHLPPDPASQGRVAVVKGRIEGIG